MKTSWCKTPALLVLAVGLVANQAMALESPAGKTVLVVSGDITQTNVGDEAHFDMAMLASLEQGEIVTQTPWHEGKVSFSGPLGVALLAEVGAQGSDLRVTALNDYAADVPASDFAEHGVVLATHKDGEPMSIREQGPLFIVYPFDDNPDLLTETYLTRSVWQVAAIDVYDN